MGRDLTTSSARDQDSRRTRLSRAAWHLGDATLPSAARLLAAMALGALLLALVYQIPITHTVDIGGYDSAYVQGFFDPERGDGQNRPELAGSDGSARWTGATSYLLFPQAGLPAQLSLRLRGWRPDGSAPNVTVLLNGTTVLDRFRAGPGWEDHTFQIGGGLLKPNDVVIEIQSETAQLGAGDPREVGVLIDRATFHAGPAPVTPYPPQLLYGALAAGFLWLLLVPSKRTSIQGDRRQEMPTGDLASRVSHLASPVSGILIWLAGVVALGIAFLALYRAQPPYPYPLLRLLPATDALLAALLVIRSGPALARRAPALLDGLAVAGLGVWTAAALFAAQDHVTLSIPGVEKDFRVFALRSAHLLGRFPGGTTNPDLDGVLRADGFYNLGYPLLLWIARPLAADNPFLAARLIAALSGALLLAAGWWLARRLLGRGAALLALLLLALSPLIVEYALYVGTDMPFAAVCMLALALLIGRPTTDDRRPTTKAQIDMRPSIIGRSSLIMALAGLAGGTAFLIRHPGLLLLPFGWLVLWWAQRTEQQSHVNADLRPSTWRLRPVVVFTLAFALATLPQVAVNLRDTGQPFYSQQAKNVWQAMFGAGDWGRWGETANDISLGQVVAQDPQRFLANWWANLRGYFGTGGEDTREFGQSVQLRLLAFPANWLAIGGLLGWLAIGFQQWRRGTGDGGWGMGDGGWGTGDGDKSTSLTRSPAHPLTHSLLLWIVLYVGTLSIGLAPQPRFFLPLAPVYALAAAWTVTRLQPTIDDQRFSATRYALRNISLIVSLTLLALLWGSFAIGSGYVLRDRPADEVELARAESRAELPGQPADEARIIRLVQATLQPGERLIVRADPRIPIGKYSAIAHLALPAPASDAATALRASGARYLLWDTSLGVAPAVGGRIAGAGSYTLYRIDP